MLEHLTREQAVSVSRISALVVVNALIFQEVLSNDDERVQPLRHMLRRPDFIGAIEAHWDFILHEIDYIPIFDIAGAVIVSLSSSSDADRALRSLANIALNVVRQRTALRHDLMGRVYHRLLGQRETKSLATFYTSVSAATLLLKLALDPTRWSVNWSDKNDLEQFRIGDLACGTGTLLMAAAEVVTGNYVRSCVQESRKPNFDALQRTLLQRVIFGYDVLPSARHLTASTLALRVPKVTFQSMNLWSLPLGVPGDRLGSIEFLLGRHIALQDFRREAGAIERVSASRSTQEEGAYLPDLDLCVMNPPFTRSSHANLLFGSLPDNERLSLQRRLVRLLRGEKVQATGTAGLGSVFVAIGDRALKQNGRMALVLPKAILSGGAWQQTRDLFHRRYRLEYLIVSHDPERWNFSDNTSLSEVLVVARRAGNGSPSESASEDVTCLNLWRNPRTVFESLAVADSLARNPAPSVEASQGALEIRVGDTKFGEAVSVSQNRLKQRLWILPCAFAQTDLVRAVQSLLEGAVHVPGRVTSGHRVPLTELNNIAQLGPDIRDIYDGFEVSAGRTAYPALWGHDANTITTLAQQPNAWLSPLSAPRQGRHLRQASDLWPKAARLAIATRLRINTQRVAAIRLDSKILSNVWWPVLLFDETEDKEKGLALWLNSTLGLLLLFAHRQEVQGSWAAFQKPILNALPVLNLSTLPSEKTRELARVYDLLSLDTILPFPKLIQDRIRQQIDDAIAAALDLPDISVLRELLSREPIVSSSPLY